MSDHGHELEFGVFVTPAADAIGRILEQAQLAEVRGLDLVTLQDHPYQAKHADTWTLLSAIGSRTTTIKLSPNMASVPLRPPVVLAKAAATLDPRGSASSWASVPTSSVPTTPRRSAGSPTRWRPRCGSWSWESAAGRRGSRPRP